jgi:ABC-type phosphate transport system substrate-binding protein
VELADTSCQAIPIDNISRLMATMIFSGQAKNWSDFGAFYPAGPIVSCLRHAGSGTHATLQLAVMKGNGWGWPVLTYQNQGGNTQNWFNDGSGDMMKCISGPGAGDPVAWSPAWSSWYAIGYADADQLTGKTKDFPNVHALNYQGVEPKRWKIRNGEYDFWSYQWIYQDPNEANPNNDNSWVTLLMNYAKEPENVPFSKVDYWATEREMKYQKAGSPSADYAYPGKAATVAEPLVP